MKIRFLTAIMGILMGAAVSAQDISKYQYPHHVNISWETEPSTSQSVNWRTNELQKVSFVEYTEATASPFFEKDVKRIEAESETFEGGDDAVWNYHSANIIGLKPNTLYSYRVGNGNFWAEWAEFRTATGTNEPFTFLYYGDVQRFILSKGSRAIRQSIIHSPEAKFMLFGGDMVHRGGLNKENWNEFFQTGEWIYQNYPIIGTPGNHEHLIARSGENLSEHWGLNFRFPQNGPEGHKEETFYVDYNNIRVISLNLCRYKYPEDREVILKWTEERLKEFKGDWVFITHHYAMDASARNRTPGIRFPDFKALYEKYEVPIILTGHEHLYARGRMDDKFPVYVVSVSGPWQNAIQFGNWIERAGTSLQLFQEIKVTPTELHYVSKTITGELYDEFTVTKDKKGKLSYEPGKNLPPESLVPPADFKDRYKKELVDSWESDLNTYLNKKK